MPPTLVFADDGKNGELGPPPSSCIESGAIDGLTMRSLGFGLAARPHHRCGGNRDEQDGDELVRDAESALAAGTAGGEAPGQGQEGSSRNRTHHDVPHEHPSHFKEISSPHEFGREDGRDRQCHERELHGPHAPQLAIPRVGRAPRSTPPRPARHARARCPCRTRWARPPPRCRRCWPARAPRHIRRMS